jgi:hypothetical protein
MAVHMATPDDVRCRTAGVEQFISCTACSVNMKSMAHVKWNEIP